MKDYKVVFVILHYKALKTTIDCVESIRDNIDTDRYEIVIVDNFSNDKSGEGLLEKYEKISNIHVIINKENLGFAKGNNIGFYYAKYNLKADFICMMNNDTLIIQKDFTNVLIDIYNKRKYAVLGPIIYMRNDKINPVFTGKLKSKEYYKRELYRQKKLLLLSYLRMENIRNPFRKKKAELKVNEPIKLPTEEYDNIILHGCCLIFSQIYISEFDGLDERTFLFREEELLFLRLKRAGMLNVYSPRLKIKHLEDVSTDMVVSKPIKKRRFGYRNQIQSLKILISEMTE